MNDADIQACIENNTKNQLFTQTAKPAFVAQTGLANYQLLSVTLDKSTIRADALAGTQFAFADGEFKGQILEATFDWSQTRESALAHAYTQIISDGLRNGINTFFPNFQQYFQF